MLIEDIMVNPSSKSWSFPVELMLNHDSCYENRDTAILVTLHGLNDGETQAMVDAFNHFNPPILQAGEEVWKLKKIWDMSFGR